MTEKTAFLIGFGICIAARIAYCVWYESEYGEKAPSFGAVNGAEYALGGLAIGWLLMQIFG
ncbi:MAG: hypothetical protein CMJ94_01050 [Planctomycetes bacterium]|nr:hypothetical protein [Planctomycetota bacterium]